MLNVHNIQSEKHLVKEVRRVEKIAKYLNSKLAGIVCTPGEQIIEPQKSTT